MPFHPHCLCLLSPHTDLINPKPKHNFKTELAFLASLPAREAVKVAGSRDKAQRILSGKETLEGVYNQGKDELYKWKRVGDAEEATPKTTAKTGADVSNAYEVAKGGGRHHGVYVRYRNQRTQEIEKSIRSLTKRINEHEDKIARPMQYVHPDITERHLTHLVSTLWPKEIMDFKMKVEIMKGILQERSNE